MSEPEKPHEQVCITEDMITERRDQLERVAGLIWLATGALEVLIGLRIFLKLIAANPQTPFAAIIYGVTAPFLYPFFGLTITPSIGGSVLEISSIIAMIIYALFAYGIVRLVWILFELKPPS
jgi:uncharacterized protein YggT (Ycf19 family)